MKAVQQIIRFSANVDQNFSLEIDTVMQKVKNKLQKTLRIETIFSPEDERTLAQLIEQEAIELRDFLNYCYPEE